MRRRPAGREPGGQKCRRTREEAYPRRQSVPRDPGQWCRELARIRIGLENGEWRMEKTGMAFPYAMAVLPLPSRLLLKPPLV